MRNLSLALLLCVLLAALGCGDIAAPYTNIGSAGGDNAPGILFDEKDNWATDYVVLIDPSFDDVSVYNAQAALNEWEQAVPVHFSVWIATCDHSAAGQICIHNGKTEFPDGGGPGQPSSTLLGWTYWNNTNADVYIYYFDGVYDGLQRTVFLHESMHAMGGIHHNGPYIMNPLLPPPNDVDTITADDANQWFTLRGLPTIPEDGGLPQ